MKHLYHVLIISVILGLVAAPGFADALVLRNGQTVNGYYEGGTVRVVRFLGENGVKEYDILSIAEIRFGKLDSKETTIDQNISLKAENERIIQPISPNAAQMAFTVPTFSKIAIFLVDGIDSEVNKVGDMFAATLAKPLIVDSVEVAPKGSDVRGTIIQVEDSKRLAGSAELRLELSQITVNGISYPVSTSDYQEIAEGRGRQTARRVGGGAAIGAIIGAIAGGGKGAAIGSGVGAGAGTAVQVLTKGEKLKIPSETMLDFTLREPLVIGAK